MKLQTYKIVEKNGQTGIKCFYCGKTSFHPMDVKEKFCGFCHQFHPIKIFDKVFEMPVGQIRKSKKK